MALLSNTNLRKFSNQAKQLPQKFSHKWQNLNSSVQGFLFFIIFMQVVLGFVSAFLNQEVIQSQSLFKNYQYADLIRNHILRAVYYLIFSYSIFSYVWVFIKSANANKTTRHTLRVFILILFCSSLFFYVLFSHITPLTTLGNYLYMALVYEMWTYNPFSRLFEYLSMLSTGV